MNKILKEIYKLKKLESKININDEKDIYLLNYSVFKNMIITNFVV